MERFEKRLIIATALYALIVGGMALYFLFNQQRECSADGYLLINGLPVYEQNMPVRCARLPL